MKKIVDGEVTQTMVKGNFMKEIIYTMCGRQHHKGKKKTMTTEKCLQITQT